MGLVPKTISPKLVHIAGMRIPRPGRWPKHGCLQKQMELRHTSQSIPLSVGQRQEQKKQGERNVGSDTVHSVLALNSNDLKILHWNIAFQVVMNIFCQGGRKNTFYLTFCYFYYTCTMQTCICILATDCIFGLSFEKLFNTSEIKFSYLLSGDYKINENKTMPTPSYGY